MKNARAFGKSMSSILEMHTTQRKVQNRFCILSASSMVVFPVCSSSNEYEKMRSDVKDIIE